MKEEKWQKYLEEVLSFVRFRYDHREIRRELKEHMEDLYEELLTEGFAEDAAAEAVLQCMGDAEEIGRALDKEHGVVLGWLWRVTRVAVIVLVLANLPLLFGLCSSLIDPFFQEYELRSKSSEIYRITIDEEYPIYDDTLLLKEVIYYEDGTLDIRYASERNPFARSIDWGLGIFVQAFDETGERLHVNGGGWKQGGYYGIGQDILHDVPLNVKTLEISCSGLIVVIDLETGEVWEK